MSDLHKACLPFLMGQDPSGHPMFHDLEDDVIVYSNYGHHITAGDFRALAQAMIPQPSVVLGALDTLASALTEHGHIWTDGERAIYELAVEEVKA